LRLSRLRRRRRDVAAHFRWDLADPRRFRRGCRPFSPALEFRLRRRRLRLREISLALETRLRGHRLALRLWPALEDGRRLRGWLTLAFDAGRHPHRRLWRGFSPSGLKRRRRSGRRRSLGAGSLRRPKVGLLRRRRDDSSLPPSVGLKLRRRRGRRNRLPQNRLADGNAR
jgi:hypothetical protein